VSDRSGNRPRSRPGNGSARVTAALAWALAWELVACGAGDPAGSGEKTQAVSPAIDRPNIVLVIGDDHGYRDAGFMGNDLVQTPHLDRLAAEGTVFTTAYNSGSACRPSLFTLLTGLGPYPLERWRLRRTNMGRGRKDPNHILDLQTLPGLLTLRGYRSFQAGKHWEGSWRQAGFTAGTKDRNLRGPVVIRMSGGEKGLAVGRTTMQPVWDFLEDEPTEPFLLWFAPMLPHIPMNAGPEIRSRYAGAELSPSALAYYANISWLDDAVGQLVAKLEDLSLLERTLIVYVSDNGWDNDPQDDHREGRGRNLGGERGKMSMRELGFRTPIIFHWAGHVPAGRVRHELIPTADLFPTLLGYAGLATPPGREGIDLRPAIASDAALPVRTIYGYMGRALSPAISATEANWRKLRRSAFFSRSERWHYFYFPAQADRSLPRIEQLYDLRDDPLEEREISSSHPEVTRQLQSEIEAWRARVQSRLPTDQTRIGEWESSDPALRQKGRRRP
jgi:uncharacterized sulfatase